MAKKTKINMSGGGFQHTISSTGSPTRFVEWVQGYANAKITIHIDTALVGRYSSIYRKGLNYGWLCEARPVSYYYKWDTKKLPYNMKEEVKERFHLYEWCENNISELKKKFIKVFTHDVKLAAMDDIFQLTLCSGKSFLEDIYFTENRYPPVKNKLVSMIASDKVLCEAHEYRQEMIKRYSLLFPMLDHFGRGYNEIADKADGLKDYYFSIATENATYSNMSTENLTDCFMTGTIHIYYGIDNIGDFFNRDGIIIMDDDFDINDLTVELYQSKQKAVLDNYKRAKKLLHSEDFIFKQFIEPSI